MTSQVLSGAVNATYTNNTGQNVRVVINYMESTPFVPAQFENRNTFGGQITVQIAAAVPAVLTLNWAGVSVTNRSDTGNIIIGRNLAYTQLYRDTALGGTQSVYVGLQRDARGNPLLTDRGPIEIYQAVGVDNSVALAAVANNASGLGVTLPTELMIAPGQTFSAVCGVHNIIIIPEAG